MTLTPSIRVPLTGMDAYLSIFGANGRNLSLLEGELGVTLAVRGSDLEISGGEEDAALAARVVDKLMDLSARGAQIDRTTLRYAAKLARQDELDRLDDIAFEVVAITHRGRPVRCKTLGQYDYVRAIRGHELTFAVGPAGTGKTYLAMALAVVALRNKEIERIVLTRPAVEAGEKLGFLPGDLSQKVDPYLRPLYDALYDMMGAESYQRLQERGVLEVAPLACHPTEDGAVCVMEKDGGDDADVTTGLPVAAEVVLKPERADVQIFGGPGVGLVTKPGLDQPVGEAAINHVPREMIAEALQKEAESAGYAGGFAVTVSIEGGAEVAKRTFNPHIGVEGGLSVLGTSGIVEPMSQQAILDTIQLEMNQAALRAKDHRRLILAPGNYGLDYLHETYPQFADIPVVKTSNFIGDTLDIAAAAHFKQVLLVGHIGKLCKLAGGIMNTHSHTADCRTELFCTHAALCGADREVCTALYNAATTDACLEILDTAGLREPVLQSLLAAIQLYLDRRAGGAFRVGAVLFSNQHGPLGQTETAARLFDEWKE